MEPLPVNDPGDENDGPSDFEAALNGLETCPFCDEPLDFSRAYCTPVFQYGYRNHRTIVETFTTCDSPSCLRIVGDLAKKREERLKGQP